jgi:hypothetical protein
MPLMFSDHFTPALFSIETAYKLCLTNIINQTIINLHIRIKYGVDEIIDYPVYRRLYVRPSVCPSVFLSFLSEFSTYNFIFITRIKLKFIL